METTENHQSSICVCTVKTSDLLKVQIQLQHKQKSTDSLHSAGGSVHSARSRDLRQRGQQTGDSQLVFRASEGLQLLPPPPPPPPELLVCGVDGRRRWCDTLLSSEEDGVFGRREETLVIRRKGQRVKTSFMEIFHLPHLHWFLLILRVGNSMQGGFQSYSWKERSLCSPLHYKANV